LASDRLPVLLLAALLGCGGGFSDPSREFAEPVPEGSHDVVIHQPDVLGVLDTDRVDVHGAPVGVGCDTCHGPALAATPQGNPEEMHSDVDVVHGDLVCASCHDDDRTRLRRASGKTLEMDQAMELCAQCHGPQKRDYDHGSHGGMNGYWDLRQGPRSRNHCLDCHGAHAPQYQGGVAVHPPRDRFLRPRHDADHDDPKPAPADASETGAHDG